MSSKARILTWALGAAVALGACGEDVVEYAPGETAIGGTTVAPVAGTTAVTGGATAVTADPASVASGGMATTTGDAGATTAPGTTTVQTDLPCDVAAVLSENCSQCHGEMVAFGAPMPLTKVADFMVTVPASGMVASASVVDRITRPVGTPGKMPGLGMPDEAVATLKNWIEGGMQPGTEGSCTVAGAVEDAPTEWGDDFVNEPDGPWPGGVKPEEKCYQFLKHGVSGDPNDTTPHRMGTGEGYVNFYYGVPWDEPVVATRWKTIYDRKEVLHHWLLYKYPPGSKRPGQFEETIGSHVGEEVQLVAGWAVGGGDEDFPEGVGLRMPLPGELFMLEWHLYNTTGAPVDDRSGIEICVVPESQVHKKYIAGLTWVGTEDFGPLKPIPVGAASRYNGVCTPARVPHYSEVDPNSPITIIKWLPHMHEVGVNMESWILRADGSVEHVFNQPFQFDQQISYNQTELLQVMPGDKVVAECTYNNTTSAPIIFGPSTNQEMCYQFTVAYPAGLLDNPGNGLPSLTGASNTCISSSDLPETLSLQRESAY